MPSTWIRKSELIFRARNAAKRGYGYAKENIRRTCPDGYAHDKFYLGCVYAYGEDGIAENWGKAWKLWCEAAEQGDARAQFQLGAAQAGAAPRSVREDHISAHMWLNIANDSGYGRARELLDLLSNFMNSEQIVEAQKRAREWLERHNEAYP